MSIHRFLYTCLLYLLTPIVLLKLLLRSRKNPAYRQRLTERFGFFPAMQNQPRLWLHAVSVGESIAAKPLIKQLLAEYPNHRLLVTTMTPTGSETVQRMYGNQVEHVYLPYDLPGSISRFLQKTHPEKAMIMETEIWPNLYAACQQRNIPIVIANARLSVHSTQSYKKFRSLIRETLQRTCLIAARDEKDVNHFLELGAPRDKTKAVGNLKYDLEVPEVQKREGKALQQQWHPRPVWLAASTHSGEDEIVLAIYQQVKKHFPDLLLIIVPRHPERFDEVNTQAKQTGFSTQRRSQQTKLSSDIDIVIGDTLGEMFVWYAAADIVFMGGSLVKSGGHNPLEALVLGTPVISGSHIFNWVDVFEQFEQAGALWVEESNISIQERLLELLKTPEKQQLAGHQGQTLLNTHTGATSAIIQHIHNCKT
jgi:3-deoxy-D-manno-octulosonic-acid transferase